MMEPQIMINIALGGAAVFGLVRHWRTAHALDDIDGAMKPMRRNLDAIVQDWDCEGDGFAALRRMHASLEVFAHRGIERLEADVASLRGDLSGKAEQLMEGLDELQEKRNDVLRRLAALEDGVRKALDDIERLGARTQTAIGGVNGVADSVNDVASDMDEARGKIDELGGAVGETLDRIGAAEKRVDALDTHFDALRVDVFRQIARLMSGVDGARDARDNVIRRLEALKEGFDALCADLGWTPPGSPRPGGGEKA